MTSYSQLIAFSLPLSILAFLGGIVTLEAAETSEQHRKALTQKWLETQFHLDKGEFHSAISTGRAACDLASKAKVNSEFRNELEAITSSAMKFAAFEGSAKSAMEKVTRLRAKANAAVSHQETSQIIQMAIDQYMEVNPARDDIYLLYLQADKLIADCQGVDVGRRDEVLAIDRRLETCERNCVSSIGQVTFLHTAILAAKIKVLQRKGEWTKAAANAKARAEILDEVLQGSSYHIQSLSDLAASLAFTKKYKEAGRSIAKACSFAEATEGYKCSDLGVTAYLLAGQIAMGDGRLADAEKEFESAQRIIEGPHGGKISKDIVIGRNRSPAKVLAAHY